MSVDIDQDGACAEREQTTTQAAERVDKTFQKRVSACISQHSTIVEDPTFQTPRTSQGSFPDIDVATITEPSIVKAEPEHTEELNRIENAFPTVNALKQLPRKRHKKSHSEHVGPIPRRRRGSEASAYRRSYIVESAHDIWASVRHSTILAEGGGTANKHLNQEPNAQKARRRPGDTQQTKIDNTSSYMKDRLKEAAVRSGIGGNRRFVPRDVLKEIVNQKSVEIELTRWQYLPRKYWQAWRRPTAVQIEARVGSDGQSIGKTYRLIFAILLALHRPSRIWSFIENDVSDADLPLVKAAKGNRRFELRRRNEPGIPLKCFKKWTFDEIGSFAEQQWMFLAPSFSIIPHQPLEVEHILPFNSWSPIQDGGYGEVYKTEIHSGHHNFGTAQETHFVVAVKQLRRKNMDDAAREADILRSFSSGTHSHKHIISLLATYEHNGGFYLIFPLADADLQRFWRRCIPCNDDPDMGKWLIEQCLGIASALCKIHRYETFPHSSSLYKATHTRKTTMAKQELASILEGSAGNPERRLFGRHGDVKPNNILLFADTKSTKGLGTLKVTDFGITRFSTEDEKFLREDEKVSCTHTYQSPECVLAKSISTACDIWALGCLYLEFILWYLRGYEAVQAFSKERDSSYESDAFFERTSQDKYTGVPIARVKPCVTEMIANLRDDPSCTSSFQNFLDLIEGRMLVPSNVNTTPILQHVVPEDTVVTSIAERISSGTLMYELGTILQDYSGEGAAIAAP